MMTESRKSRLAEYNAAKKTCPARDRLAALFDDGVFSETGSGLKSGNGPAGVVTAYGYINGNPAYAFSQDNTVMSGAVSKAHSAKICRILELAARNGVPAVGVYDSGGAFIEDGADALNAYSDILLELGNISGVVPVISVISGVCAGTMAMIAASADFTVITKKGELYANAGQTAPSAENASASGLAAASADSDGEAMEIVRKYLSLMPMNNLSAVPEFDFAPPTAAVSFENGKSSAETIADADSLLELYSGFGECVYTALGTIGGASAGIASAVGKKLTADDCAKLTGFVRLCDAYSVPVVTVIDTEGFETNSTDVIRAYARLCGAYAEATCPKIAVVSGNAWGSAFIALAGRNIAADAVIALPDAVIAPVAPETAAEFLYHDRLKGAKDLTAERKRIADEYAETAASSFAAAEKGAVDDIAAPEEVRAKIISVLEIAAGKRLNKRLPKKHSIFSL